MVCKNCSESLVRLSKRINGSIVAIQTGLPQCQYGDYGLEKDEYFDFPDHHFTLQVVVASAYESYRGLMDDGQKDVFDTVLLLSDCTRIAYGELLKISPLHRKATRNYMQTSPGGQGAYPWKLLTNEGALP